LTFDFFKRNVEFKECAHLQPKLYVADNH
jgi:hypothetical protein